MGSRYRNNGSTTRRAAARCGGGIGWSALMEAVKMLGPEAIPQ